MLNLKNILIELVKLSTKKRTDLFVKGDINSEENASIHNEEVRLLNLANQLANLSIEKIATDLKESEAKKVLEKTITDFQGVIKELEDFNSFIGIFAKLINVFSRISQVVVAGGGAIAVIRSLVNELIDLSNPATS